MLVKQDHVVEALLPLSPHHSLGYRVCTRSPDRRTDAPGTDVLELRGKDLAISGVAFMDEVCGLGSPRHNRPAPDQTRSGDGSRHRPECAEVRMAPCGSWARIAA